MEEWLDEILPPGDGLSPFEYGGEDFDDGGEGDEDEQFRIVMQLGDQSPNATSNGRDEEWFASSRKPRKYRPPNVIRTYI